MSFSFKSIGHECASILHDVWTGMTAVAGFIEKIDTTQNQALLETVTGLIPVVGPEAVAIERGVFAVAGQTAAVLGDVTKGGEQALLNAGFDAQVIADFKALIESVPGLFAASKKA